MGILTEPKRDGGGGRLRSALALLAALVVVGIALWVLLRPRAGEKTPPPVAPRARATPSPRPTPAPSAVPAARATPRTRSEARPEAPSAAAATLRVDADVPGANVFLDREFLGTTPVEARDLAPGEHRLNVSAEGYEMYGEPAFLTPGPNSVVVKFKAVRLDERVDVVHKHGVGSCKGRLVATPAGLTFEAEKADDTFHAPLPSLEPLQVDYLKKSLRVKQKGGKTWNFTSDDADALLVFQKAVEGARKKM